jgi:hypothetical protein
MADDNANILTLMRANVDSFNNQVAKMKGIPAARISADMQAAAIADFSQSVKIILSEKTKNEIPHFLRFKLQKGAYCTHYQTLYKKLFGEALYTKLLTNKLQEQDKIEICAKFIERLVKNRPIVFYGPTDIAICFGGKKIEDPNYFVTLSSHPTELINYISYPELEFSRRLAFSCLTYLYRFTGDKHEQVSHLPILVHSYSGLRFDRAETPEYKRLISSEKNKADAEWVVINENPKLFLNKTSCKVLAKELYENYLADANQRAQALNKKAYVRILNADLTEPFLHAVGEVQFEVLKEILNEANFDAKYPHIEKIEISYPYWKLQKKAIKNNKVIMKEGSNEDTSAYFSDPMEGAKEKGSTEALLLCINNASSPNAYIGNRIYANYLSSADASMSNCTNITAILNPSINPFLAKEKFLTHIAIHFSDGYILALTESQQHKPDNKPAPTAAPASAPAHKHNSDSKFNILKKIILTIYAHAKVIFIEIYARIKEKFKKKS